MLGNDHPKGDSLAAKGKGQEGSRESRSPAWASRPEDGCLEETGTPQARELGQDPGAEVERQLEPPSWELFPLWVGLSEVNHTPGLC